MTMAHANPTPLPVAPSALQRWKIELKVIAATAATLGVSVALAVLNTVAGDHELLGPVPSALQFVIVAVIPSAITFLSGYMARHTPRGPAGG